MSTFSVQTSPATRGQLPSLQGDAEGSSLAVTQTLHRNQLLPGVLLTLAAQGDSEGWGVPVDRLNVSWECTTAVTKANQTRGCIHRDTPRRNTNVIVPLSSVLFQITPVILYPLLVPITHKKRY